MLWVRGEDDVIVSDTSMFDLAHLGAIGAVPGWDGTPAQPRVAQTRHVLERYAAAGGTVREVAVADAGHTVHLERPEEFGKALLEVLPATCEVHDEHGHPVHLTPHQWRHTFARRLINRDVPQEVVRVLLDHESSRMTAHYARITDQTVRRRWEEAMKVNIKGERVVLESDGLLGQVRWAKTRYGIATQTLPNGYCGLPVQKTYPHANACLTCPVFPTGPEFLPELREQRTRTLALIDNATGCGHTRGAEMNQQVADNLDRMISELQDGQDNPEDAAHAD